MTRRDPPSRPSGPDSPRPSGPGLDMSPGTDALGSLAVHARADLDDAVERELRFIAPDFAAVVEAAHARDPRLVPFAALVEAQDLAPVVPLGDSSSRLSSAHNTEFAALLADARAEADADAAAARPRTAPVPPARWSRRWLWGLAAAAAVLLAVSAQSILATRQSTTRDAAQAPMWERQQDGAREAEHVAPEPAPRNPQPARAPIPEVTPEVAPEPIPEPIPEPAPIADEPPVEPVQKTSKPRPPARETAADRLRRLDAEAEAAWQSGDFAGAEQRYREILRLAPGSRAADLSYGDLFALSRQRSGPDAEEALWREYLAAFPRGRYADDARAGLCRRAAPQGRPACWQQYLADFPAGSHRAQADRALP